MKKLIALASASILALAFAAPVFAEGNDADACLVDGVKYECTVPGVDLEVDAIQKLYSDGSLNWTNAKDGKIYVCQFPGAEDSVINGGGYNCIEGGGHIIEISLNAAMAHGLLK